MRSARLLLVVACGAVLACVRHEKSPDMAAGAPCACRAHAPKRSAVGALCGEWGAVLGEDGEARSHVSFPELDTASCFVRVRYRGETVVHDEVPKGCGYPEGPSTFASLEREGARYDAIADGARESLPHELSCALPEVERTRVARANAVTLRATRARLESRVYPYAAVSTFGYGSRRQLESGLESWRPGDACRTLTTAQMQALGSNVTRAGRAAAAWHAHVAPVITVSGGAVHAPIFEAYLLHYLLSCRFSVPSEAILMDPCADHTHTNVRNTGGLVVALGGRAAYVVTDTLQSGYLQEWTAFDLIGGSIDQRALRDFGYLLGSFRQASVGARYGFWLTPYRFWAEPRSGLGSFTCVR